MHRNTPLRKHQKSTLNDTRLCSQIPRGPSRVYQGQLASQQRNVTQPHAPLRWQSAHTLFSDRLSISLRAFACLSVVALSCLFDMTVGERMQELFGRSAGHAVLETGMGACSARGVYGRLIADRQLPAPLQCIYMGACCMARHGGRESAKVCPQRPRARRPRHRPRHPRPRERCLLSLRERQRVRRPSSVDARTVSRN